MSFITINKCFYRPLVGLLAIDGVAEIVTEYLEKNLWDYSIESHYSKRGCNNNADSCENWNEYLALIKTRQWANSQGFPVTWSWEMNTNLFETDSPPYYGDVLFLDWLGDYSHWIKVKKENQDEIVEYLKSVGILQSTLDFI